MQTDPTTISQSWLITQAKNHKKPLIVANVIAVIATLLSVPIPLLMPLMVDEVLLNQPGKGLEYLNTVLPYGWQNATGYILVTFFIVVLLRSVSQGLNLSLIHI